MTRRTVIVIVGALCAIALGWWLTHRQAAVGPEAAVQRVLDAMVAAAEAGKASEVLEHISGRFEGPGGIKKAQVALLLRFRLQRSGWRAVHLTGTEVERDPERPDVVWVRTRAVLSRGKDLELSAGFYRLELGFQREGTAWRLVRGTWERQGLKGVL